MLTTAGKWSDFLSDRRSLDAIYTEAPELLEVFEVSLSREGPRLDLRIEVDRLPSPMPKKWAAQDCNRVQVLLRLSAVRDFRIAGWGTDNIVATKFTGKADAFSFELVGHATRIEGTAGHMFIAQFTAYRSE